MHALDNPIWRALTTLQARFAHGGGGAAGLARRFEPEVTGLAGMAAPDDAGFAALAGLLAPGESTGVFLDAAPAADALARAGLVPAGGAPIVQMLLEDPAKLAAAPVAFLELGAADVPEMVDLATRTRPGPFATRTRELGRFIGVREGGAGKLLAMAGERMRVDGFTEVSGVCTDPSALGRGLAAALIVEVAGRIRAAGAVPFLHVKRDNLRAIGLYERLGFRIRRGFEYVVVARAPGGGG